MNEPRIRRRTVLAGIAAAPLLLGRPRASEAETDWEIEAQLVRTHDGFAAPWGIALDKSGSVYITDSRIGRVVRRSPDSSNTQIIALAGRAQGSVRRPQGIAVSPDGEVYVVDGGNRRIQVFGPDGVFRRAWGRSGSGDGHFNVPRSLAVGPDNALYVADGFNDRIQKFELDGEFVTTWGKRGRGPTEFSTPTGIAVSRTGMVYVTDTFRDRIQVFQPDGTFVRFIGAPPLLRNPIGIAVDEAARVYVTEDVDHRVTVFDHRGDFVGRFGGEGTEDEQFQFPRDIAVDELGDVYVADSLNHSVKVFATDLPSLVPPDDPEDLAAGVALSDPLTSELPHNLVDLRVRLDGRLWTVDFRHYYESTGGLVRWGWPISEPLRESASVVSQYFQRGVMDWSPDGRGERSLFPRPTWELLGGGRGGSLNMGVEPHVTSTQEGAVVGTWNHRVSNFAVDGTFVGFEDFYEQYGGQAQFGAPRTEARTDTGEPGTVMDPRASRGVIRQYFQNAVLEHVPGLEPPVELRLIGDSLRDRLYPNGGWRGLAPFQDAAAVEVGEVTPLTLLSG